MSYQSTIEIAGLNLIIKADYEYRKAIAGRWRDGEKMEPDEQAYIDLGEVMINHSDDLTPDFKPIDLPESVLELIAAEILGEYI